MAYLHIPFCESLCPFCAFHRVTYRRDRAERYFRALRLEIDHYAELGFELGELYVGGGTPTVDMPELVRTLEHCHARFDIRRISVETNPNHLTPEVVDTLLGLGVQRISVGVQSFDDGLLAAMGRLEPYGSGAEIAARLTEVAERVPTLNADFIFNLPGQTEASLERDLEIFLGTGADQASFYPLMVAEASRPLVARHMGRVGFDHEQAFYERIRRRLTPTHPPSSVWCFSRDADEIDEYVVEHEDYLGIGSGAFGYLDGLLYANAFSILDYEGHIVRHRLGALRGRQFGYRDRLRYRLLMGLMGLRLPRAALERRYGRGCWQVLAPELTALRLLGAVRTDGDDLVLTPSGMGLWLVLMREFFTGVNNFRDAMRRHMREEYAASYGEEEVVRLLGPAGD